MSLYNRKNNTDALALYAVPYRRQLKQRFPVQVEMSEGRACAWPNGQDEGHFGGAGSGVADGLASNGAATNTVRNPILFFWCGLQE
jgi:hypothetical protein